jgi:hypothetical protein
MIFTKEVTPWSVGWRLKTDHNCSVVEDRRMLFFLSRLPQAISGPYGARREALVGGESCTRLAHAQADQPGERKRKSSCRRLSVAVPADDAAELRSGWLASRAQWSSPRRRSFRRGKQGGPAIERWVGRSGCVAAGRSDRARSCKND